MEMHKPAAARYIDVVTAARMARQALKQRFPGVKFSVRCERASMSRSIDVQWVNGPTVAQVDEVVGVFAGSRFDGSIDMRYGVDHWLLPDGSVQVARSRGTAGSGGCAAPEQHARPHPEAELVRFGVDFVMTARKIDPATWAAKIDEIMDAMGTSYPAQYASYNGEYEDANTHAHRFFSTRALPAPLTAENAAA
jgi:hypothetical protein